MNNRRAFFVILLAFLAGCGKTKQNPASTTNQMLTISSFLPVSGTAGTRVTVVGTGFNTDPTADAVTVGGKAAQVISASSTQIIFSVPPGASSGIIGITVGALKAQSSQVFIYLPPPATYDVYVSGLEVNSSTDVNAVYWKNSAKTFLNGAQNRGGATSISYEGGNLFVSTSQGSAWKNGALSTIMPLDMPGASRSINTLKCLVTGSDYYQCGYIKILQTGSITGTIWKNGMSTSFSDGSDDTECLAITASSGDIYVAGFSAPFPGALVSTAKYWKNGVVTSLTDGVYAAVGRAISITGADVYVAGTETDQQSRVNAKYWKNGTPTLLPSSAPFTYTTGVYVNGADVYVSGYETSADGRSTAVYWKNGAEVRLTDGSNSSQATGIAVAASGDVYISGYENLATVSVAKIWLNGTATSLTDGSKACRATGIALVRTN